MAVAILGQFPAGEANVFGLEKHRRIGRINQTDRNGATVTQGNRVLHLTGWQQLAGL